MAHGHGGSGASGGSRVTGGGNFIQPPASLQATINFGMEDILRAPGRLFDALAEQAADEQEAATAFLRIVAQSNPDMLPLILKDDPDLIRLLTGKPQIQFPGGKGKDGQRTGGERGSLGLRVQAGVVKAQAEIEKRKGVGSATFEQRRNLFGFLFKEETNEANLNALQVYHFGEETELVNEAFFFLQKFAPRSTEKAGLSGAGIVFLEEVEFYRESQQALSPDGIKPTRAEAIKVLQTSSTARLTSLENQLKIMQQREILNQQRIEKGQLQFFDEEEDVFTEMGRISQARIDLEGEIAKITEVLNLLAAEKERRDALPTVPGQVPFGTADDIFRFVEGVQPDVEPEDRASPQMLERALELREQLAEAFKRQLVRMRQIDRLNPRLSPAEKKRRAKILQQSAGQVAPSKTIDELINEVNALRPTPADG